MALLFMDGFNGRDGAYKYDPTSVAFGFTTSSPRTPGSTGHAFVQSTQISNKTIPLSTKVIAGMGIRKVDGNPLMDFYSAGVLHIRITVNASGFYEIRRGASTVLATSNIPFFADTWYYMEASVTLSSTIGEVHLRFNGSTTDNASFIGNTIASGSPTGIDRVTIGKSGSVTTDCHISDFYILDGTGTSNNDFLGDVVVRTVVPQASGTYSQLVGSDGNSVDNYQLVDETPFSATDFVGSTTVGAKDTYVMGDLPTGVSTVYGVQVSGLMQKSDATLASARYVFRSGGNDYFGMSHVLSTSPIGYYELFERDPATSLQWTVNGFNAIEAGMEVA